MKKEKKCPNKKCKHKGVLQPIANFYKCKVTTDGYRGYCKDCDNDRRDAHSATRDDHWLRIIIG